MKKTRLRKKSKSEVALLKEEIQHWLRACAILRDKTCVLRKIRNCYNEVYQFDHLIERSNSATYADLRLGVLLCKGCHGWKHFKKSNHDQYNELIKSILPKDRVELWEKCEKDSWKPKSTRAYDWKLQLIALKQEYKKLKKLE